MYRLNASKAVTLLHLQGTGAHTALRNAHKSSGHRYGLLARQARYLGVQLTADGSCSPEIQARIAATKRTWSQFGAVWSSPLPFRVLRLFFLSFVVNTLVAGLTPLLTSERQESKLSGLMYKFMKYAWTVIQKRRHPQREPRPNRARIHQFWRVPDIATELRVRRLQEYARWALHPERHSPSLAAVFGQSRLDRLHNTARLGPDGTLLATSTPWAHRVLADLRALCHAHYRADLLGQLDRDIRSFFRPGPARDQWTMLDPCILRVQWLSHIMLSADQGDTLSTCSSENIAPSYAIFDGETYCPASFESYHAMVSHSRIKQTAELGCTSMCHECMCVVHACFFVSHSGGATHVKILPHRPMHGGWIATHACTSLDMQHVSLLSL
jgi:hypothetical protein